MAIQANVTCRCAIVFQALLHFIVQYFLVVRAMHFRAQVTSLRWRYVQSHVSSRQFLLRSRLAFEAGQ